MSTTIEAKLAEAARTRTLLVHMLADGPRPLREIQRRASLLGVDPDYHFMYAQPFQYDGETWIALDTDGMAALMRYRDRTCLRHPLVE